MNYLSDECSKCLRNFYVLRLGSEYPAVTLEAYNERFWGTEGLHSLCVVNRKVEAQSRWNGLAGVTCGTNSNTSNWTQSSSSRLGHLSTTHISSLWFCLWLVIKYIYQFLSGMAHSIVYAVTFQLCMISFEKQKCNLFTEQLKAFIGKNIVFTSK